MQLQIDIHYLSDFLEASRFRIVNGMARVQISMLNRGGHYVWSSRKRKFYSRKNITKPAIIGTSKKSTLQGACEINTVCICNLDLDLTWPPIRMATWCVASPHVLAVSETNLLKKNLQYEMNWNTVWKGQSWLVTWSSTQGDGVD